MKYLLLTWAPTGDLPDQLLRCSTKLTILRRSAQVPTRTLVVAERPEV